MQRATAEYRIQPETLSGQLSFRRRVSMKWEGSFATGGPVEDGDDRILLPSTPRPNTWIAASPSKLGERRASDAVAYPMVGEIMPHSDGRALEAQPSTLETSTPGKRSWALVVRSLVPSLTITF